MRYQKYTLEGLKETASQYTTRQQFKKGSPNEYKAAHSYGHIDEVTSHMIAIHSRTCSKCGDSNLDIEDFVKNSACTEGRTQKCKKCDRASQVERRIANLNYKENRRNSAKRAKDRTRAKMLEYHGGTLTCTDCKFTSTISDVFDYHHIDRTTKEFTVSSILDYKWETVKAEMDKCILLCANCHRIRHSKEHIDGEQSQENEDNPK